MIYTTTYTKIGIAIKSDLPYMQTRYNYTSHCILRKLLLLGRGMQLLDGIHYNVRMEMERHTGRRYHEHIIHLLVFNLTTAILKIINTKI